MELNQLRYLQTVAKFGQMTKAAEELHSYQSSLSKTIATLEKDVGVQLFDRLGNRIVLNSVGRAFLDRVNRSMLELDDAVREANASDLGSIHFAVNTSGLCTNFIDRFLRENPRVKLRQSLMDPDQMAAALERGELDCAVCSTDLSSDRIRWTGLAEDELLLLISKEHPLADQTALPLSACAGESFICNNAGFDSRELLLQLCQMAGFSPNIVFDGNEPELAFQLVAGNHGVMMMSSIVYRWLMDMEIINPPLHFITAVHITRPICRRLMGIAVLNNHYMSKTTEQFIDGLNAYFSTLAVPPHLPNKG